MSLYGHAACTAVELCQAGVHWPLARCWQGQFWEPKMAKDSTLLERRATLPICEYHFSMFGPHQLFFILYRKLYFSYICWTDISWQQILEGHFLWKFCKFVWKLYTLFLMLGRIRIQLFLSGARSGKNVWQLILFDDEPMVWNFFKKCNTPLSRIYVQQF